MPLRATATEANVDTEPGDNAEVLIDGAETPTTANGLDGYTPTPGDRLLIEKVGGQLEIMQFLQVASGPGDGGQIYIQATPPPGQNHSVRDIWYNTSQGNQPHRWDPDGAGAEGSGDWEPLPLSLVSPDQALVVSGGGDIVIEDGGDLKVREGGTVRLYYPGDVAEAVTLGHTSNGSGVIVREDDGSNIFEARGDRDGTTPRWRFYDSGGRVVMADRPSTLGWGLRYPVLSGHWSTEASDPNRFPDGDRVDVDTTAWTNTHICEMDAMSSKVTIVVRLTRASGAPGVECRITVNDGTGDVVADGGEAILMGTGSLADFRVFNINILNPAKMYTRLRWRVQCQKASAGAGLVGVQAISIQQGGA